jgi:uncharacterized membrane protein
MLNEPHQELSSAVIPKMYMPDDNTMIKTAAMASYVLINSLAIGTYVVAYEPNKRPGSLGVISTAVISTALLVTILVSF